MNPRVHIAMDESYDLVDSAIIPYVNFRKNPNAPYIITVAGTVLLEKERGQIEQNGVLVQRTCIAPRARIAYHVLDGYGKVYNDLREAVKQKNIDVYSISYCRFCEYKASKLFSSPFPNNPILKHNPILQLYADDIAKKIRWGKERGLRELSQSLPLSEKLLKKKLSIKVCKNLQLSQDQNKKFTNFS